MMMMMLTLMMLMTQRDVLTTRRCGLMMLMMISTARWRWCWFRFYLMIVKMGAMKFTQQLSLSRVCPDVNKICFLRCSLYKIASRCFPQMCPRWFPVICSLRGFLRIFLIITLRIVFRFVLRFYVRIFSRFSPWCFLRCIPVSSDVSSIVSQDWFGDFLINLWVRITKKSRSVICSWVKFTEITSISWLIVLMSPYFFNVCVYLKIDT